MSAKEWLWGGEETKTLLEALGGAAERTKHANWFYGLLKLPLPAATESFHSQRLLLLYFAVVGGVSIDAPWLYSEEVAADVERELQECFDATSGGFAAENSARFVTQPTLTLTHCALFTLAAFRRLESALTSWLPVRDVARFILSCQSSSNIRVGNVGSDSDRCSMAFAAHPMSREVDVRFSYSATMSLHLLVEAGYLRHPEPTPLLSRPDVQQWLEGVVDDAEFHPAAWCAAAVRFIDACWSPLEGGFGGTPEAAECHGGMTYCAASSLWLLGAWWQCERGREGGLRRQLARYCVARVGGAVDTAAEEEEEEEDGGAFDEDPLDGAGDPKTNEATATTTPTVASSVPTASKTTTTIAAGFCGRPQKPCDTCYTFWMGATLRLLESTATDRCTVEGGCGDASWVCDSSVAQFVAQCAGPSGGFGRDSSDVDPLHAALALTGLATRLGRGFELARDHINDTNSCCDRLHPVLCRYA